MAEIVVQLLLERLSSLIVEEAKLLGEAGREVNELMCDLDTMRSFLRDADSKVETNQGAKTWVMQVRDVAYDTEDVLDEFLLRLVRPRKHGIFDYFTSKFRNIKLLNTRHDLATEVQNIKTRLKAISERRISLAFTDIGEGSRAYPTPNAGYDPRYASLHIDEAKIVGIEVPKEKLIGWLTEGELKLTIISVVGMGGLGKTTLVKKVYDDQMVNKHFGCHVWITVSQSPVSTEELLRTTIKKVLKETKQQAPEEMDTMDVHELTQELDNQLSAKRYVIIFDDIWDINVWEAMRFAFPDSECGSRIIFTTRTHKVAECSNYVHDLKPLEEKEALRLFCMKAFESDSSIYPPTELQESSQNILKKCGGLPLAIVLIASLLRRKPKTVSEWKSVHDTLGAEMKIEGALESFSRILLLSYNNLPYYLKPCYLYLSMFPEDYFIKRMMLIRLWIAEGFIEEKQGVTLEVVAGDYVNELISRSMIQVAELNDCNEVKSCRIHDLVREIIQSKSKEENFSTTIIGSQGMGVLKEAARRISIYHKTCEKYYSMSKRCSHIRSLLMIFKFGETPYSFEGKFFGAFRLLRVLDLEGANLLDFPYELVELIHLRYLSLRNTKISVLPKSVGNLEYLETLDLKQTRVSLLPVEIFKLQRLRHLLVYRYDFDLDSVTNNTYGVSVPTGIGKLTSLQKLAFLDVQNQPARDVGKVLRELGKLTQLRRLGITNLTKDGTDDLCLSLQKMEHLSSLSLMTNVRSSTGTTIDAIQSLQLESLTSPPQLLHHLYLNGRLSMLPGWIASLTNLAILKLRYSRLSCENDPLEAFQQMPNLMHLELSTAYEGDVLRTSMVGGYQNLKKLFLLKMEGLKRVEFMEGSICMLRELHIWLCPALDMVPVGIEHLKGLQELQLWEMHPRLVEKITKIPRSPHGEGEGGSGEDCWKVEHIPTIKHIYRNTQGGLVYENLE